MILKTMISFADEDGRLHGCDTIQHEGRLWLVPAWHEPPDAPARSPVRVILLDVLDHQKSGLAGVDFVLNEQLPRAVFDGRVPTGQETRYVVIERPEISLPTRIH